MNADLHCDLLSYYLFPHPGAKEDLGCSVPYLLEGNVVLQVMAIYSATTKDSTAEGRRQIGFYKKLLQNPHIQQASPENIRTPRPGKLMIVCAIENASSFCEEDERFEAGLRNLQQITDQCGRCLYIGLTHHTENRFGGGNGTTIGLKADGRALLEHLHERNIAIDLAHTSDKLAYDILNHIDKKGLSVPVLASHSNSRTVHANSRNLPDELMREVIKREGLIGLNFIKDYINREDPDTLYEHIDFILKMGGEKSLCYGADFFYDKVHPDKSRYPFFFEEYGNALAYDGITARIEKLYGATTAAAVSHRNATDFISKLWGAY